jgi:hypothetical protein
MPPHPTLKKIQNKIYKEREDKEEGVNSYWITLRKREGTGKSKWKE